MQTTEWESQKWERYISELRTMDAASGVLYLKESGLDANEQRELIVDVWNAEMHDYMLEEDFASAFNCIRAALLGSTIFEGPNRVSPMHFRDMPVGITCSPQGVSDMLHKLYMHMYASGIFKSPSLSARSFPSWKVTSSSGELIEILQPGCRLSAVMFEQRTYHFYIAGLMALSIGEWTVSRRMQLLQ